MNLDIKNIHEWPVLTRSLVIVLICAVVFYLGYRWDISGLKSQIMTEESKEKDLKQQYDLVINKEMMLIKDNEKFASLKSQLAQWQGKMVTYSEVPEILNEILKTGSANHIYFSQFDPGEEAKAESYFKFPIKVVAVGSYHQIADFISQIANMPWIVVIGDLNISRENKNDVLGSKLAEQANAQGLLTAEIMLEVYHLPDKNMPQNLLKPAAATTPGAPAGTPPTGTTPAGTAPATTPPPANPAAATTPNATPTTPAAPPSSPPPAAAPPTSPAGSK